MGPVPNTFFCYFVTNSHHSGAGYGTTYQHTPGTRPYWYSTGYSLSCHIKKFSNLTDCPTILSPIPTIPVLVVWQQNKHTGCQSLPVRSGVRLPLQICPLIICHQFPPAQCWSCDNSSKHTQGARAYQPGTGYSYPLTDFLIVTNSHRWSCDNILTYTGVPTLLVTVALSQKENF